VELSPGGSFRSFDEDESAWAAAEEGAASGAGVEGREVDEEGACSTGWRAFEGGGAGEGEGTGSSRFISGTVDSLDGSEEEKGAGGAACLDVELNGVSPSFSFDGADCCCCCSPATLSAIEASAVGAGGTGASESVAVAEGCPLVEEEEGASTSAPSVLTMVGSICIPSLLVVASISLSKVH